MNNLQKNYRGMLADLFRNMEWAEEAACKGMDTSMFFPERGASPAPARLVCARCPVKAECLEHAMTSHERSGVWGGLTYKERGRLARMRRMGLVSQ